SVRVDHGELDSAIPDGSPRLFATSLASTIYKLPNTAARKLGYVRLGQPVARDAEPVKGSGCQGDWYRIYPVGFMCTADTTTDAEHPLVRAAGPGPDRTKPMPYRYGFVRATSPQYVRLPNKKQQFEREAELEQHLARFADPSGDIESLELGANDVALDARGVAVPGLALPAGQKTSKQMSIAELFGGSAEHDGVPFWLDGGKRLIPNVADYKVTDADLFAGRVNRHTGLSFVGTFNAKDADFERRFGVTVDLRLIPTSKVKPDGASPFHGIEIPPDFHFPFAFVLKRDVTLFKLIADKDEARPAEPAPRRALVPLSGNARIKAGRRYYQTLGDKTRWLSDQDIGIVHQPDVWPDAANQGEKWIDISIGQQTLVLYEGKVPRYATLISSGRDRFGDPKKDHTTPLGDFRLQSKHVAAAMDSNENSTVSGGQRSAAPELDEEGRATVERLKKARAAGQKLSAEDERRWKNVEKGRHPEYGVTRRRGSTTFELRDVPWIQYFSAGFALHGAYWHDVFGLPRSHGCVNLAPIDARLVFEWTDPPVPSGWHGVNIGEDMGKGTAIHIRR
ncbi:MAG TPA: L,D-transpeptidase, partial [Polyangiaceae bacterium]|nr:L,D-transpeptidase [Polyangiaceae bacterium]